MIVPVKKVKLFFLENEALGILKELQRKELIMLDQNQTGNSLDVKLETEQLLKTTKVIDILEYYLKKRPFLAYDEVTYPEFSKNHHDTYQSVLEVERLNQNKHDLIAKAKLLAAELTEIIPFNELSVSTKALYSTNYVSVITGYLLTEKVAFFKEKMADIQAAEYELLGDSPYGKAVVLFYAKEVTLEINELLSSLNFKEVKLKSYQEPLNKILGILTLEQENNNKELQIVEQSLSDYAGRLLAIKTFYDYTLNEKLRKEVKFKKTETTIYYEVWVREDKIDCLKETINAVSSSYEMEVTADKASPTALKNNKFVAQFEDITNMFAVPNKDELDPNPVMSVWYWLIFGIMMGDIGYGLVMVIGTLLFLKLKKPKGSLKRLLNVFFYSGFTTIVAGIIFGSFFGVDFDIGNMLGRLFGFDNWTSVVINPVNDALTMLIVSIAIGAIHMIFGLVMKIINCLKHKDLLSALAEGVSWILIIIAIPLFVLLPTFIPAIVVAASGALLILCLSGRNNKNIFGKITSGLGGLYNITGYLSDLLSYSRILALSLSSAIIASTMNMLAGMVSGGFGWVFSCLIYLVGHVFNFVMGMLSAYVHDGRLQYLEFYGKFFEGGGYLYQPFALDLKYLDNVSDNN